MFIGRNLRIFLHALEVHVVSRFIMSWVRPGAIEIVLFINSPKVVTAIYLYFVYFALKPPMTLFEILVVSWYIGTYSWLYYLSHIKPDEKDFKE